ncbi:MAG TPA: S-layer homology domain-containing protein [Candidatus Gastranaerophilales bacterium]|nr:S-layer homology domain-containing protein [Candidatus Gastranaerophilales bacterium]
MNLRKLSIAATLSIGIMTFGGIAKADQTGAACPICPPQKRIVKPAPVPTQEFLPEPSAVCPEPCPPTTGMACPVPVVPIAIPQTTTLNEVFSPLVAAPACPNGAVMSQAPIGGYLPNCAPNAKVVKRQAFAFPDIGSASVVIPMGERLVQIGGEEEALAINGASPCGIALVPQGGALGIVPQSLGGAAPLTPGCFTQVTQGMKIDRCKIPGATNILQSALCNPCNPCASMGAAAPIMPVNPCDPCNPCAPMGGAAPIVPVNPCDPCNPCSPFLTGPTGSACPVNPCDPCNPCAPTGFAAPMSMLPTGAAAQLGVFPRSIQTSSGIQIQKTSLVPVLTQAPIGAACPVSSQFPDVSNNMIAGCDINKLASQGILAGYPDRSYKPNLPIMRDEMASALVSALELENVPDFQQQIFKDVPNKHWANSDVDKAYNRGLMAGFPNNMFKPDMPVSRAEALSTLAKAIPGEISSADAQNILNSYSDANELAGWAAIPVAEALNAGLICNLPNSDQIRPNDSASRAEVASMLKQLRDKLGLEPAVQPTTGAAAAIQPQIVTTTIPTLKLKFEDIISARTSEVGDRFVAKTTEAVSIDGAFHPAGTNVYGKVAEVIRPGIGQAGAIRVDFLSMGNDACKTTLPKEVLSATVVCEDNPNIVGRLAAWPFSWPGKVAGIAGRTVGGTAIVAANTVEYFLTNIGNGNNELFNGKLAAAGRSYFMAGQDVFVGVFDTAKTALSGTVGILKESGDEIAYVIKPDGSRVAQINPNEVLSIAFATNCQ